MDDPLMNFVIGPIILIIWVGAGFAGASIRAQKGYAPDSCAAIVWGGVLYLLVAVLSPDRHGK